ncbi:hypothetical protein [Embleya sp. NPDC005575]|uniref:hypothetical protein n=1 Tax=Embleya sp. NPDC005575 TaxID=3156892 RepID=UPI0033BABDB5
MLAEDAELPDRGSRSVLDLYDDFNHHHNLPPVSYRWVWEYVTHHPSRSRVHPRPTSGTPLPNPQDPSEDPTQPTWAQSVAVDTPAFVSDLIIGAARQLTGLKIEADRPAEVAAELGLVSTATAIALITQAMNELALAARRGGVPYSRISEWTGIPQDTLTKQVEDYHRHMTL